VICAQVAATRHHRHVMLTDTTQFNIQSGFKNPGLVSKAQFGGKPQLGKFYMVLLFFYQKWIYSNSVNVTQ